MRVVPIYHLRTWKLVASDEHHILYRPTFWTFFLRLRWTLAAAIFLTVLWYSTQNFREPLVVPALSAEEQHFADEGEQFARDLLRAQTGEQEYERLLDGIEQERAERAAADLVAIDSHERIRRGIVLTVYGVATALIAMGLLPPISCAWARIAIGKDLRGQLCVRSRGVFFRRRNWPSDHFDRIATWVMERYWFGQHGRVVGHAWEWIVQLSPRGLPSMPYVGDAAIAGETVGPQFFLDRQKHRPLEKERAPESVRTFVKALRVLTGLTADPPQIVEVRLAYGWFRARQLRRVQHPLTYSEPVMTETHTFQSMDEIPPELRARMAEMLRSGEVTRHTDGTIEVVSEDVIRSETFDGADIAANWNKIPPDIRAQIERMRGNRS